MSDSLSVKSLGPLGTLDTIIKLGSELGALRACNGLMNLRSLADIYSRDTVPERLHDIHRFAYGDFFSSHLHIIDHLLVGYAHQSRDYFLGIKTDRPMSLWHRDALNTRDTIWNSLHDVTDERVRELLKSMRTTTSPMRAYLDQIRKFHEYPTHGGIQILGFRDKKIYRDLKAVDEKYMPLPPT